MHAHLIFYAAKCICLKHGNQVSFELYCMIEGKKSKPTITLSINIIIKTYTSHQMHILTYLLFGKPISNPEGFECRFCHDDDFVIL